MKKSISLLAAMILLISATFISCSDDDFSSSDLVGSWTLVREAGYEKDYEYPEYNEEWDNKYNSGEYTIEFKEDKTYIQKENGRQTYVGDWRIKGNKLYTYDYQDDEEYKTTIVKLTATELETEDRYKDREGEYYEKMYFKRLQ